MVLGDNFCLLEQPDTLKFLTAQFRVMMVDVKRAIAVNFQPLGKTWRKGRYQHDEDFARDCKVARLPAHVVKQCATNQKFTVDAAFVLDNQPFNRVRRAQAVHLVGDAHCEKNFLLFGVEVSRNIFAVVDSDTCRHCANELKNSSDTTHCR